MGKLTAGDFHVLIDFKLEFLQLPTFPHFIYPIHKFHKVSYNTL